MARAAAVLVLASACGLAAAERPNVLLVLADDLNDWVGALGAHPNARTPAIDRLASQGALFAEAYAASPKCNPSRTALLLGLSPATTGIYDNGHWWRPHLPDAVTLPEAFRAAGYLVAGGGKVFHHTAGFNPPGIWDEYFPLRFDDPWDRKGAAYPQVEPASAPAGHPLSGLEPFRHELDWGALDVEDGAYGDSRTVDWASEFLARPHEKPFLLVTGLFHPHLPWYAPQRFFDAFPPSRADLPLAPESDLDDIPAIGLDLARRGGEVFARIEADGRWAEAVAAYAANIAYTDSLVGRLLGALESSPHAGSTIVVFASDHGFHLGEKRHWYKSTLWERSTHVPLIVRAPGVSRPGARSQPVSLLDIFPTLLDLAGLPARPELDGRSLRGLLEDPGAEPERHVTITYLQGNHAVRQGKWLYIRYRDGGEELYDRGRDPAELENLAGRPEFRAAKEALRGLLPSGSAPPAPTKQHYDFDPAAYSWSPRQ